MSLDVPQGQLVDFFTEEMLSEPHDFLQDVRENGTVKANAPD